MLDDFTMILAAAPEDTRAALRFGLPIAHMAYRVAPGLKLIKGPLSMNTRGGLMMLSDAGYYDDGGSVRDLVRDITRECNARTYDAVVADFALGRSAGLNAFLGEAVQSLKARGVTLFVTPQYEHIEGTQLLISGTISGGSLRQYLEESAATYGAPRLACELERLFHDFPLPAPDGKGRALGREGLSRLMEKMDPLSFFSQELCAYYFTYKDERGGTHFVLYDDAPSLAKRCHILRQCGVKEAFFLYPEVKDILEETLQNL